MPPSADAGGVWIVTGIVLGALAYGAVLLMLAAGYSSVLPVAVVPPVLVILIGGTNLLGARTTPSSPSRPYRMPRSAEAAPTAEAPPMGGPPPAPAPAPGPGSGSADEPSSAAGPGAGEGS